jgi:hypothetical protein
VQLRGRKARQRAWLEEANRLADARVREFESDPQSCVRAVLERGAGWFELRPGNDARFHELVVVGATSDVGATQGTLVDITVTWRPPPFSGSLTSAAKQFFETFEPRSVPWSARRKITLPMPLPRR